MTDVCVYNVNIYLHLNIYIICRKYVNEYLVIICIRHSVYIERSNLIIIRTQITVLYIFAGIKKLNGVYVFKKKQSNNKKNFNKYLVFTC